MEDSQSTALLESLSRLRQSVAKVSESQQWSWLLFGQDIKTGKRFNNSAVGPVVSLGLPWLSADCSLRWLGSRFLFWPAGIPWRRRISIVSSRLKQRLDEESWWFDLLRTAVLRADPATDVLCTATNSSTERFVSRAADLFGRSVMEFRIDATESDVSEACIAEWLFDAAMVWTSSPDSPVPHASAEFLAEPQPQEYYAAGVRWPVYVSAPMLWPVTTDASPADLINAQPANIWPIWKQPIADRILFSASDRLQVLRTRHNGAIQSLLTHHVQDPERRDSLVMLAGDAMGQMSMELSQSRNVIPWLISPPPKAVATGYTVQIETTLESAADDSSTVPNAISESTPLSRPEEWLLHWTRPAAGPWPDQEMRAFEDELILGCQSSDRSALATLLRIVNEKRLWASSEAIRGAFPVVSFTEVALNEFRGRRTYRKHRRRFDFEPWGIAIRRDALTVAGAQPVTYGDDETWLALADDQRPFFQNINAGDGWTRCEREWRVRGHVALDKLPATAVAVFCETAEAREIIMKQTDWPVFVVP